MYRDGGHGDDGSEVQDQKQYDIRPFYQRLFFNLSLWLGGSRDELHQWPPGIPKSERMLLRYWIDNAVQLMEEGTSIEVQTTGPDGKAVNDSAVRLTGNYNSIERKEVVDQLDIKTDTDGKAYLSFPKYSVITSTWFISAEKDGIKSDDQPLHIVSGRVNKIVLMLR
jgi:hypothetical protein